MVAEVDGLPAIRERLARIEAMHQATDLRIEASQKATDSRLSAIEGYLKWVLLTFLSGVVLAAAAFVVRGGLNP